MTTKIYVRERVKIGSGVKQPKFKVVAVTNTTRDGTHLRMEATHFRKIELEEIAKDVGAELVYLHTVPEEERGSMKG